MLNRSDKTLTPRINLSMIFSLKLILYWINPFHLIFPVITLLGFSSAFGRSSFQKFDFSRSEILWVTSPLIRSFPRQNSLRFLSVSGRTELEVTLLGGFLTQKINFWKLLRPNALENPNRVITGNIRWKGFIQ